MKPAPLLRSNSELRAAQQWKWWTLPAERVWNWTLPAWVTTLPDGRRVNACPAAGACVKLCYARQGTYLFPAVRAAHQRNLARVLDDLPGWEQQMTRELHGRRFRPTMRPRLVDVPREHLSGHVATLLDVGAAAVRIHDSGDYLSADYLQAWLRIAAARPSVLFYSYTKEVELFRTYVEGQAPPNFLWVYSLGGRQDHLLDLVADRHADVFPDEHAITAAGYVSQDVADLLSVLAPTVRIGIPANNIPGFRKRQGDATFGQLEAGTRRRRS